MIEHSQLWIPARPTPERAAPILSGPEGEPLGAARWLPGAGLFVPATLAVHEHDETPLLFQARRAWTFWRRHGVTDADDRLVGYVRSDALLTAATRPIVWRIVSQEMTVFHIVGGPLLATERGEGSACWLNFAEGEGTENPFLRMLVLAAVLLG
jgi:hypothetical protein